MLYLLILLLLWHLTHSYFLLLDDEVDEVDLCLCGVSQLLLFSNCSEHFSNFSLGFSNSECFSTQLFGCVTSVTLLLLFNNSVTLVPFTGSFTESPDVDNFLSTLASLSLKSNVFFGIQMDSSLTLPKLGKLTEDSSSSFFGVVDRSKLFGDSVFLDDVGGFLRVVVLI